MMPDRGLNDHDDSFLCEGRTMKKLLMGASALAIAGFGGAAVAQEWSVRTGGFMTAGIGYVDADAHQAEVEVVNNAEVIFNFTLVADNGITFNTKVEFEANGSSNNADEYVASAQGSFGRIEIGSEDGVHDRLAGEAPGSAAFTSSADGGGLLFDYASGEMPFQLDSEGRNSGDNLKITYFTPKFSGFQAGFSYSPGGDGGTSSTGSNDAEVIEFGAAYKNTFGDIGVSLGAGYSTFQDNRFGGAADRDQSYSFMGALSYAGFTAGAQYGVTEYNAAGADDVEGLGVGVEYATGPWGFGLQYTVMLGGNGAEGFNEDDWGVGAGVDYALAPGVTVGAIVEYGEADVADPVLGDGAWAVGVFSNFNF